MSKFMMVLADGETFTDLEGCCLIEMPDDFDGDTPEDPHRKVVARFTQNSFVLRDEDIEVTTDTLSRTHRVRLLRQGEP